jgi:hypothetical protein
MNSLSVTSHSWFSSFAFWQAIRWDIPAVMLVILLGGFAVSLVLTQRRKDFDFADAYRDENGKVSAARVLAVGSWVVASWIVMQDMLDGVPTPEIFWAYCVSFSGSLVLSKAAEKWNGSLPWGK